MSSQRAWLQRNLGRDEAWRIGNDDWFAHVRLAQYPLLPIFDTWLVIGGRGSGKTRLGAEWVNAAAKGFMPYAARRYGRIALVGETFADVREVMIEGPSGILATARHERPRYEPSRRRLVWESGAVAQAFSSEDPESLRGPQFDAAWCDARTIWASLVTVVTAAAGLFGLPVGEIDNSALVETLLQAITAVSGLLAIFGRLAANSRIG